MVAARRIIALSVDADQRRALVEVARSRNVAKSGIKPVYQNKTDTVK